MAPHSERQSYHTKKQGYFNKQIKPEEIIIRQLYYPLVSNAEN